jgi:hypothetical protein
LLSSLSGVVQRSLMRHSDIRTTMSYGDLVTDEAAVAAKQLAGMAISTQNSPHRG